jgi:mannitol/fructose-specific phosphotransferase system IIA component (Ntr-type)
MEDPERKVNVEFVFNMALKNVDGQLAMLREIMAVAQDADFLRRIRTMPPAELRKILGQRWKAAGAL